MPAHGTVSILVGSDIPEPGSCLGDVKVGSGCQVRGQPDARCFPKICSLQPKARRWPTPVPRLIPPSQLERNVLARELEVGAS